MSTGSVRSCSGGVGPVTSRDLPCHISVTMTGWNLSWTPWKSDPKRYPHVDNYWGQLFVEANGLVKTSSECDLTLICLLTCRILEVKEPNVFRVPGDERPARLDVLAHQHQEQPVGGGRILQRDLQQQPVGGVH